MSTKELLVLRSTARAQALDLITTANNAGRVLTAAETFAFSALMTVINAVDVGIIGHVQACSQPFQHLTLREPRWLTAVAPHRTSPPATRRQLSRR
jgi:hypothetical protein